MSTPALFLPVRLEMKVRPPNPGDPPTMLQVRVYPHDLHIDDHVDGFRVTPEIDEWSLAMDFWNQCADGQVAEGAVRSAWTNLCAHVSVFRAKFLIVESTPSNVGALALPMTTPAFTGPSSTVSGPAPASFPLKGLPDRWRFTIIHRDGSVEVHDAPNPIRTPLLIGAPPVGEPLGDLAWLVDFDDPTSGNGALQVGMGTEIDLTASAALGAGLRAVLVSGISSSPSELNDLFTSHAYTRGMGFVPDGDPTNNTSSTSPKDLLDADHVFSDIFAYVSQSRGSLPTTANAARWQDAVPLTDAGLFAYAGGAETDRDTPQRAAVVAVKSTYLDPSLDHLLGPGSPARATAENEMALANEFYPKYFRPSGPYCPLRVGDGLYGLLPCIHPGNMPLPGELAHVIGQVSQNGRVLVEEVARNLQPQAEPALDRLARVAHPNSYATHTWAAPAGGSTVPQNLRNAFNNDLGGSGNQIHAATYAATYAALDSYIGSIESWQATVPPTPPAPPEFFRSVGALVTLSTTAEARLAQVHSDARELFHEAWFDCLKSKNVVPEWLFFDVDQASDDEQWFHPDRVDDRIEVLTNTPAQDDADEEDYYRARLLCRGSGTNRTDRAERLREIAGAVGSGPNVATLAAEARQLVAWLEDVPAVTNILFRAWRAFGATALRNDALDSTLAALGNGLGPPVTAMHKSIVPDLENAMVGPGGGTTLAQAGFPEASAWQPLLTEASVPPTNEWHFRAALGGISYRLDSWFTAIASMQLDFPYSAVALGSYGMALDIEPFAAFAGPPRSEGYVLAQTPTHATTAAVLRSGWLAHEYGVGHSTVDNDAVNPYAIRLNSYRTRRARDLIETVREGHDLGDLLGRWVEEGIQDRPTPPPLSDARTAIMGDSATPINGATALALLHQLRLDDAGELEEDDSAALPTLHSDVRLALDAIADDIAAMGELLRAEGVHQLVQRRLERAFPALDATTPGGGSMPSTFEVMSGSTDGNLIQFQAVVADTPVGSPVSPRGVLAEGLEAWCARWLDVTACTLELAEAPLNTLTTLDAIGLSALDACLESKESLLVRAANELNVGGPVSWLGGSPPDWLILAQDLGQVIRKLRPLRSSRHGEEEVSAFLTRVESAHAEFAGLPSGPFLTADEPPVLDIVAVEATARALLDFQPLGVTLLSATAEDKPELAQRFHDAWLALSARVTALRTDFDNAAGTGSPEDLLNQRDIGEDLVTVMFDGDVPCPAVRTSASAPAPLTGPSSEGVHRIGRVRRKFAHLAAATLVAEARSALGEGSPPPLLSEHSSSSTGLEKRTLFAGPGPTTTLDWDGYALDEWTEVVPTDSHVAGLAMHVDVPASQPPAAMVLSPPLRSGTWDMTTASELIQEVEALLRIRGVGPNEYAAVPGLGPDSGFLPLTYKAVP